MVIFWSCFKEKKPSNIHVTINSGTKEKPEQLKIFFSSEENNIGNLGKL